MSPLPGVRAINLIAHPRVVSGVWAAWAWASALAYVGRVPAQLDPVVELIPAPAVAWVWAAAAGLLSLGALTPAGCAGGLAGRWARGAGLAVITGLLAAWAVTYAWDAVADGSRMWVAAKNYAVLTVLAMLTSPVVGRDRPRPPEVRAYRREGGAGDGGDHGGRRGAVPGGGHDRDAGHAGRQAG